MSGAAVVTRTVAGFTASEPLASTDSECFRCSEVTASKTAEMLYMSSEWDYYYCYRCRGWFKRLFSKEEVVLPVTDRRVINHLTWMYASHMEAMYENRRMLEQVGRVWHGLERRLPRILPRGPNLSPVLAVIGPDSFLLSPHVSYYGIGRGARVPALPA